MQTDQLGEVLAVARSGPDVTVMVLFACSQWDLLAEDWKRAP